MFIEVTGRGRKEGKEGKESKESKESKGGASFIFLS